MAHPVAEFRSDVATLRQQIAELTARLDQLAPPQTHDAELDPRLPAGAPEGAYVGPDGLARDGRGNLIHAAEPEPYEVRQAAALAEHKAKQQAEHDKAREGLDGGLWMDPSGIVRTQSGELASAADIENARADAVRQLQANEHRAYKQAVGLPVLPARVSLPVRRVDPTELPD
jgi:hypothetical protein